MPPAATWQVCHLWYAVPYRIPFSFISARTVSVGWAPLASHFLAFSEYTLNSEVFLLLS